MAKREKLVGVSVGAGVLGALFLALRYAVRPPTKEKLPDSISPAIFATKVMHTSLGQVVYHESGSGQPLIFVHSVEVGASSYEWSKVYPEFAAQHRVLALDLIGFGESERREAKTRAADHARALAEFIRATCDQPPILIGSGLGAGFCALVAAQHPELIARLVLFMPTGAADFGVRRPPRSARVASQLPVLNRFLYRNQRSTKSAIRLWLMEYGFVNAELVTDEMVDIFTTCARQYGAEHAILNLRAGRFAFDLEARLRELVQPVTLVWSDAVANPALDLAYRYQSQIPTSSLIILRGIGVLPALENPVEVTALLREQLASELRVFQTS